MVWRLSFFILVLSFTGLVFAQKAISYQEPYILGGQQGLSSGKVNCFAQDEKSFIWIGTEEGLNKFDGNKFTVYRRIENDPTSLRYNHVTCLLYDSQQKLWVGTSGGVQCYDDKNDSFYSPPVEVTSRIDGGHAVLWITEDRDHNLWFSIQEQGVLRYSPQTKETRFYFSLPEGGQLGSKTIRHITQDSDGCIWFASFDQGLTVYNPAKNDFKYYNQSNSNLPTNSVVRVQELAHGYILISTLGDGLYILDKRNQNIYKTAGNITAFALTKLKDGSLLIGSEGEGLFVANPVDKSIKLHSSVISNQRLISSKIHALLESRNGDIWIGMFNDGLACIKKVPQGFVSYKKGDEYQKALNYGQITGVTTDRDNNIWFATDGGGLNFYNRKTGYYTYYTHQVNNRKTIPDNAVVGVYCDSRGFIWAGTYTGGLCRFDSETKSFVSYNHSKSENSISGNYVKSIVEDKHGNFWLGIDGGGISYFDYSAGKFTNYSARDNKGLVFDFITCLYLQDDDILWVGTHAGISKMDLKTKKFIRCGDSQFAVYSITRSDSGDIYIGTSLGLYVYNATDNSFVKCDLPSHFAHVVVNGVIPHNGLLWLSTNQGIVCYSPSNKAIRYYINSNDLGNSNLIRSSYFISPLNEIFLGGGDGGYSFFPDQLQLEQYTPKVYLTGMEIFNEPISANKPYKGNVLLNHSLEYTENIVLRHSENTLTFRFSAPSTLMPASLSYMCYMEGVDKQWTIHPSIQQSITYANLSPGTYIFNIYATNTPSEGFTPDNMTTLHIVIDPPVWLTWWAQILYVVGVLLIISLVLWIIYRRMKDKAELNLERMRTKELEELDKSKMQFFTNISHEFRTPLTLIISPLEEIRKVETNSERAHAVDIMLRNGKRLLNLINQILDLRKAENNRLEIRVQSINLFEFIQDTIELFSDVVHLKNIDVTIEIKDKGLEVWYDPDLLAKSFFNILANALKYTPENGKIQLSVENADSDFIAVKISDTGSGIDVSELPYLFDRFYQGKSSRKSGTGIGLHLVRTITELHQGKVDAENLPNVGTCFTIYIRKGKDHFTPHECVDTPWTPNQTDIDVESEVRLPGIPEIELSEGGGGDTAKPLVLLVEDEPDMRGYIRSRLEMYYRISEAENGKQALSKLKQVRPDLIITDVMMPEMDGIEFTRIMKEDADMWDIPVILLTANDGTEQKLKGLETGADSYIVKPFNLEYLLLRMRNLLEVRRRMREKYHAILNLEPTEVDVENPDEALLQNSISFIRSNMDEPDLSVEQIAKHLNISRTNLHRKIKMLTGNSPVELIKVIRMKQAAYLLDKGLMTVSEVAFEVGYGSLSYFSSSFSAYWGVSPTVYLKNKTPDAK